jgi:hypothetical protein
MQRSKKKRIQRHIESNVSFRGRVFAGQPPNISYIPIIIDPIYLHQTHFTRTTPMQISVIYEDGTENEFEIILCCYECHVNSYGWNQNQFNKVNELATKGEIIKVPNSVVNEEQFIKFVKTL